MKAKDFKDFLKTFSDMLDQAGAGEQATGWRALLPIFEVSPSKNVGDVCKALAGVERRGRSDGPAIRCVTALLPAMEHCFDRIAKKTLTDDLKRFAKALAPFETWAVSDLTSAVVARLSQSKTVLPRASGAIDLNVVRKYLRRLEDTLGDDPGFTALLAALKKDREVKTPEAKQLARDFSKGAAKSKADAFDLIWGRHESLVGARARAKAIAGRTPA